MRAFQQDGAPSYKSEETQEWIARNFISVDLGPQRPGHWPGNSFDLDPRIMSEMKSIFCRHTSTHFVKVAPAFVNTIQIRSL
ncbi:hypothetical protein ANCDUO_06503 [Ancylostoma duodenale]|uniref:Uncharacterized protein n=1 Tax=Ancylostoma duodenale TaxID=51022 RepID=A0A0C2D1G3_9BILA|nr:hypothetical protein ANCDUO_06503 [Ancylostoma duodenale]